MKHIVLFTLLFQLAVDTARCQFGFENHMFGEQQAEQPDEIPFPFSITSGIDFLQKYFFAEIERDIHVAIQSDLKPNVSVECLNGLKYFQESLMDGKLWAFRMIDSFGKIPIGMLEGSLRAFGDYDMCVETILPGKFQGMYCSIDISLAGEKDPNPFQPLDIAFVFNDDFSQRLFKATERFTLSESTPMDTSICIPSTCSQDDVKGILHKVRSYGVTGIKLDVKRCEIKQEFHLSSTEITIISVILLIIFTEVCATFLDVRMRSLAGQHFDKLELRTSVKCFLCLSFYTNVKSIFKKNNNPDSVKIFHGMKFISMAWIIYAHTLFVNFKALGRLIYAVKFYSGFFFQIAVNTFLATETFFFMSGFLVTYSFVKANYPRFNFFHYALYRYSRTMPPLLFIIGITLITSNLGSGPMWKEHVSDKLVGTCASTWWKNVLCINNFYEFSNCLLWSWYIAVDMQLYLMAYLLLIVMRRNPERAMMMAKIAVVASIFIVAMNHAVYNLPPNPALSYVRTTIQSFYTMKSHYLTYNHITPYCMGLIFGYQVATRKKNNMTWGTKFFGWSLSFVFAVVVIFATYLWNSGRVATPLESIVYGGLHRFFWSLMLGWVTYICSSGEGGVVTSILSWDGFVPLGRLTFMAYLIHPLLQLISLGQIRQLIFADHTHMMYMFIAFTVTSYSLALVFCLICEVPFIRLLSLLLSPKLGKDESQTKKGDFTV